MFKHLALLALLLVSYDVWAEAYYWQFNYFEPLKDNQYLSHGAACADFYNHYSYLPVRSTTTTFLPNGGHICRYYYTCSEDQYCQFGYSFMETSVDLKGDHCEEGKVLNIEKGRCEFQKTPEQCAAIDGQLFYTHSTPSNSLNFCYKGCSASHVLAICGNPTCSFNAVNTGSVCEEGQEDQYSAADDNPPTNNDDNNDPPPDPNHPDPDHCPPGYYYGAGQCHKIEAPNNGCPEGRVREGSHCVTPDPNNPNEPPDNKGGDGDNGSDDNGSGNNGNGGNGSGSGSGNGNGNGSGNGNNNNNGNGNDNGNDKGSQVGGESCDVNLTCEGDAIQCAILKQQKQQTCRLENDHQHHGQMVADNVAQEAADKAAFEENSTELPIGHLFNEAKNQSGWLPKSCPAPRTAFIGGRTVSFDFSPFCQFATQISPIIVLMASLFFLITVGRAVKG